MVWILGNSPERVIIKDLNDVIYYRQKKQYTDEEFEYSKDLQREIQKGRIIKLEHRPEIRTGIPDSIASKTVAQSIDISEIKRIIKDAISEQKTEKTGVKDLILSLVPVIANTVRQEISSIQFARQPETFIGQDNTVSYIPEVETKGMKSSISIESRQIEGKEVSDSLEMLKKLQK